jgi:hypothetical protein
VGISFIVILKLEEDITIWKYAAFAEPIMIPEMEL